MNRTPIRLIVVDDHEMTAQSLRIVFGQEDDIEVAGPGRLDPDDLGRGARNGT